jgi:hypothetical protein
MCSARSRPRQRASRSLDPAPHVAHELAPALAQRGLALEIAA